MDKDTFKRKLTTVFSADAVGYSKLMGDDEAATVKTITAYQKIMTDLIIQHRGRVIDSPGDNLLAEFGSVVDAVQCAVAVQKELQARNDHLPEDRRMLFRIGINLGDVIQESDRIYGDGVNIAARLEGLAKPGGICISKTAFDHIATKLPYGYDYLGDQSVKNIDKPVGAYRVSLEPRVSEEGKTKQAQKKFLERTSVRVALVGVLAIVAALWVLPLPWQQAPEEIASEENMAYALPEEPSIAVIPFKAIGGTDDENLLSDGILTSIATALSKTPKLFTVDYASTSEYKGKEVSIKDVAEELSVRYVLLGDLQKSGDQIRINVKLIDALTGKSLWAEKYDRSVDDLFAMQDNITMQVMKALQVELYEGEYGNVLARGTDNLEAYLKIVQGYQHWQGGNAEDDAIAQRLAREAIELDPNYAPAYGLLSRTLWRGVIFRTTQDRQKTLQESLDVALKAVELEYSADTLSYLGFVYSEWFQQFDKGIEYAEKGLDLNPNNSRALTNTALILNNVGRCEEAIGLMDKALRVSPIPSVNILFCAGTVYRSCKQYDECIALAQKAVRLGPDSFLAHRTLAECNALSGRLEEAKASATEVLRIIPKYTVKDLSAGFADNEQAQDIAARIVKGRITAGLPPDKSLKNIEK